MPHGAQIARPPGQRVAVQGDDAQAYPNVRGHHGRWQNKAPLNNDIGNGQCDKLVDLCRNGMVMLFVVVVG